MTRLITTLVQIMLFFGVLACLSFMWQDLKADLREVKNDLLNKK